MNYNDSVTDFYRRLRKAEVTVKEQSLWRTRPPIHAEHIAVREYLCTHFSIPKKHVLFQVPLSLLLAEPTWRDADRTTQKAVFYERAAVVVVNEPASKQKFTFRPTYLILEHTTSTVAQDVCRKASIPFQVRDFSISPTDGLRPLPFDPYAANSKDLISRSQSDTADMVLASQPSDQYEVFQDVAIATIIESELAKIDAEHLENYLHSFDSNQNIPTPFLSLSPTEKRDRIVNFLHKSSLDLVIADTQNLSPLFAVEYDGGQHHTTVRQIENDRIKDKICELANLPLIRISVEHLAPKSTFTYGDQELSDRLDRACCIESLIDNIFGYLTDSKRMEPDLDAMPQDSCNDAQLDELFHRQQELDFLHLESPRMIRESEQHRLAALAQCHPTMRCEVTNNNEMRAHLSLKNNTAGLPETISTPTIRITTIGQVPVFCDDQVREILYLHLTYKALKLYDEIFEANAETERT